MSDKPTLTIAHLYANEMNIYGDRGNILALTKRLQWRGYGFNVVEVGVGDEYDLTNADIVFAGGGQDSGQLLVGEDLLKRVKNVREAVEGGVVMLTICGTYQLFGRWFLTLEGEKIPGLAIFGAETVGTTKRMIGNLVVDSPWGKLVGFENHSGQTELDSDQPSLGMAIKGFGNNDHSKQEGAVINNAYGTYLHGPVLPKNPHFTDHLLRTALQRKYQKDILTHLDDKLELAAADVAAKRPQ